MKMADKKPSELSQEELLKLVENQAASIATKDGELKEAGKNISTLKEKVAAVETEMDKVKKELAGTIKVNTKLTEKIAQLPKKESKSSVPSFTLDDVDYEFNYPKTVVGGKTVTIADVQADPALQREMVARGSGMIKATSGKPQAAS